MQLESEETRTASSQVGWGCPRATQWWRWVDHQRPGWKRRLRLVDKDGPLGQTLILARVISPAGHGWVSGVITQREGTGRASAHEALQ